MSNRKAPPSVSLKRRLCFGQAASAWSLEETFAASVKAPSAVLEVGGSRAVSVLTLPEPSLRKVLLKWTGAFFCVLNAGRVRLGLEATPETLSSEESQTETRFSWLEINCLPLRKTLNCILWCTCTASIPSNAKAAACSTASECSGVRFKWAKRRLAQKVCVRACLCAVLSNDDGKKFDL